MDFAIIQSRQSFSIIERLGRKVIKRVRFPSIVLIVQRDRIGVINNILPQTVVAYFHNIFLYDSQWHTLGDAVSGCKWMAKSVGDDVRFVMIPLDADLSYQEVVTFEHNRKAYLGPGVTVRPTLYSCYREAERLIVENLESGRHWTDGLT